MDEFSDVDFEVPDLDDGGSDIEMLDLDDGGSDIETLDLDDGGSDIETLDLDDGGSDIETLDLDDSGSDIETLDLDDGGSDIETLDLDDSGSDIETLDLDNSGSDIETLDLDDSGSDIETLDLDDGGSDIETIGLDDNVNDSSFETGTGESEVGELSLDNYPEDEFDNDFGDGFDSETGNDFQSDYSDADFNQALFNNEISNSTGLDEQEQNILNYEMSEASEADAEPGVNFDAGNYVDDEAQDLDDTGGHPIYADDQQTRYVDDEFGDDSDAGGPVKVLKRDPNELMEAGNSAINRNLEALEDNYRDQGLSESEIANRLAEDKLEMQQQFLNDAPLQDVSVEAFNLYNQPDLNADNQYTDADMTDSISQSDEAMPFDADESAVSFDEDIDSSDDSDIPTGFDDSAENEITGDAVNSIGTENTDGTDISGIEEPINDSEAPETTDADDYKYEPNSNLDVQPDEQETADITGGADMQPISDLDNWLGDINPNFDEFDTESPYSNNCGSCAYAVYQRLEGIDPEACASEVNIPYNDEMESLTNMEQVAMSPDEIEQRLLEQGDGAHAIIGIDRAEGPGHWFNAACIDGKVVAIDGQSGEILDWPPDYGDVVNWEMSVKRS